MTDVKLNYFYCIAILGTNQLNAKKWLMLDRIISVIAILETFKFVQTNN